MPWQITVDVSQALPMFQRLASNIKTSIPQEALQAGADQLVTSAKAIVPVRTGNLRDSIESSSASPTTATAEASADYAGFVEFGTRYMSSRPYMKPSIPQAVTVIRNTAVKLLNETIGG